jgi:hypothetical protein
MDRFSEDLREVVRVGAVLNALGIRYALGGSMASSLLSIPRFTQDADLMVDPFAGHETELLNALGPDYYVSMTAMQEANRLRRSFNIINKQTGFKLDLFVRKDRPFDLSALNRRFQLALPADPSEQIAVLTVEDVIVLKLEWYRLGEEVSQQQWRDVQGLLRIQGSGLDLGYTRRAAEQLGVADLVERALGEASPTAGTDV